MTRLRPDRPNRNDSGNTRALEVYFTDGTDTVMMSKSNVVTTDWFYQAGHFERNFSQIGLSNTTHKVQVALNGTGAVNLVVYYYTTPF